MHCDNLQHGTGYRSVQTDPENFFFKVCPRRNSNFISRRSVNAKTSVRQRTAGNYSDLSTRQHITTGSPVGKVPNGLWLHLDYIINVTHLVWVFTCRPKILSNKLAVTPTLL